LEASDRIKFIGHATVGIDINGVRLLTDPLLTKWVLHLRRYVPPPDPGDYQDLHAVLISHQHLDHLHGPSLRQLDPATPIIIPKGAGRMLRPAGFREIIELGVGDCIEIEGVSIEATLARHSGRRVLPGSVIHPLGYIIHGEKRIYFAGDTDLFPEMAQFPKPIDVALLPVWGWGPNLGPGHMDPYRAALALTFLNPAFAIPMHWGTYHPVGLGWFNPMFLTNPPVLFSQFAARLAPEVAVRNLKPGENLLLE
jgi:L-ascorbate metabolism protein UlaG (beta-lactamase superfamily)